MPAIVTRELSFFFGVHISAFNFLGLPLVHLGYLLKLMRISQLPRIFEILDRLEHWMINRYFKSRCSIYNWFKNTKTLFYMAIFLHYYSCAQIHICFSEGGWVSDLITPPSFYLGKNIIEYDEFLKVYTDAIYFVTQTMTTVGYGDISALTGSMPNRILEELFVTVLEFTGILAFALLSNRFFN